MRSAQEFNDVQRLIADGMNDCAIARITGIPRRTVRDWRCKPPIWPRNRSESASCRAEHYFSTIPAEAYCYLLGLYLGDGCISRHPRSFQLRITLDSKYPAIVDRCRQAVDILMPRQCARVRLRSDNCSEVWLYSKHWPCLFPQHGPGKKHKRAIRLEPWQQALVDQATEEFIIGLIHSDGCRVVANDRGVSERPVSLLQSVRRHPGTVHGGTRRSRNTVDSVVQVHRLHLPQSGHRPPRHIRRAKGPRGTVE